MNEAARRQTWIQEQRLLKQKLVCNDSFSWAPYFRSSNEQANEQVVVSSSNEQQQQLAVSSSSEQQQQAEQSQKESLKFIGGMDISFVKEDPTVACSALVVLDVNTMSPVYEDFEIFTLELPYIPGFLAFRECPALLRLLKKMKQVAPKKYPQLLMIDGNGILHPRGLGLASHLGVLADMPSVGIGKTLFQVDGLDEHVVKRLARKSLLNGGEWMKMVGRSGKVWGAALRSTQECVNPVFVSVGHRISLETAVEITRRCCLFRVPEPVRQADKKSREYLRLHCYTQS